MGLSRWLGLCRVVVKAAVAPVWSGLVLCPWWGCIGARGGLSLLFALLLEIRGGLLLSLLLAVSDDSCGLFSDSEFLFSVCIVYTYLCVSICVGTCIYMYVHVCPYMCALLPE